MPSFAFSLTLIKMKLNGEAGGTQLNTDQKASVASASHLGSFSSSASSVINTNSKAACKSTSMPAF